MAGLFSRSLFGLACFALTACGPAAPPAGAPADPASTIGMEAFNLAYTRAYACANGARLSIQYRQTPHEARVSADGALPAILKPSIAASGARYEAAGMSLHTKGAEVLWADFMKEETRCTEVAP